MSNARNLANLLGTGTQITTADIADGAFQANRNLIINGAMQVAQRGTGPVPVGAGTFIVDRFKTYKSNDGAYTIEQSTDAPNGFTTSLKGQVTIADTSIAAGQYVYWPYYIEAKDLQHLSYGTSSAKTITLSFWVKSNKTGVYTISVYKQDTTSYMFTHEYTISSANTWEKKTITISPTAGSTSFITSSGGAIANDNGAGLILSWNLSFGSTFSGGTSNSWSSTTADYSTTNAVNWMDSTSNNFYLTGIQLEVGETATPFEHRSYGDELARCHRYYAESNWVGTQVVDGNNTNRNLIPAPPQPMRGNPTITVFNPSTGTANQGYCFSSGVTATISYIGGFNSLNTFQIGTGAYLQSDNSNRYTSFRMKMDAEL